MVRCGNRREACCPSCAQEYLGDMWQLVYAGLAGGRKGVAEHPQVLASLTRHRSERSAAGPMTTARAGAGNIMTPTTLS
jgi:replication initiator protein RepSA